MAQYREVGRVFEAFQWRPGVDSELVKQDQIRGYDPDTGEEVVMVRYFVLNGDRRQAIRAGDWIVDRYKDGYKVMRDEDFQRNFIPVEQ